MVKLRIQASIKANMWDDPYHPSKLGPSLTINPWQEDQFWVAPKDPGIPEETKRHLREWLQYNNKSLTGEDLNFLMRKYSYFGTMFRGVGFQTMEEMEEFLSTLGNEEHPTSWSKSFEVAKEFASEGQTQSSLPNHWLVLKYKGKAFDLHKMHLKLSPPSQKKKDRGVVREQELVIPAGLYSFEVVDKG
jgi:hypothetical protein